MIRDPSDGSVKPSVTGNPTTKPRSTSAENWGLKSLDKPERKPKPAPTADELKAHYAKFGLAFQPKPESPASCDPASAPPAKLTASSREERN
jgi:hypothetical protein